MGNPSRFVFLLAALLAMAATTYQLIPATHASAQEAKAGDASSQEGEADQAGDAIAERSSYIVSLGEKPPYLGMDHIKVTGFRVQFSFSSDMVKDSDRKEFVGVGALAWPDQVKLELGEADADSLVQQTYESELEPNEPNEDGTFSATFNWFRPFWSREDAERFVREAKWSVKGGALKEWLPVTTAPIFGEITSKIWYAYPHIRELEVSFNGCPEIAQAISEQAGILFTAQLEIVNDISDVAGNPWNFDEFSSHDRELSQLELVTYSPNNKTDHDEFHHLECHEGKVCTFLNYESNEELKDFSLAIENSDGTKAVQLQNLRTNDSGIHAGLVRVPASTFIPYQKVAVNMDFDIKDDIGAGLDSLIARYLRKRAWVTIKPEEIDPIWGKSKGYTLASRKASKADIDDAAESPLYLMGKAHKPITHHGPDHRDVLDLSSSAFSLTDLLTSGELIVSGKLLAPGGSWPESSNQDPSEAFRIGGSIKSSPFLMPYDYEGETRYRLLFYSNGGGDWRLESSIDPDGQIWRLMCVRECAEFARIPPDLLQQCPLFESWEAVRAGADTLKWRLDLKDADQRNIWSELSQLGDQTRIRLEPIRFTSGHLAFKEVQMPGGILSIVPKLNRPAIFDDGSFPEKFVREYRLDQEYQPDTELLMSYEVRAPGYGEVYLDRGTTTRPTHLYLPEGRYEYSASTRGENEIGMLYSTEIREVAESFTAGTNGSKVREYDSPFLAADVKEGERVEVELPLHRHFHRIHVDTPDGPARDVRLVVISNYSGQGDCFGGPINNFGNRQAIEEFMDLLKKHWSHRFADEELQSIPELWSFDFGSREIAGLHRVSGYLNVFGDSPLYAAGVSGPLPLMAIAWTEDYAPEWTYLEFQEEEVRIALREKRERREGIRPVSLGKYEYWLSEYRDPNWHHGYHRPACTFTFANESAKGFADSGKRTWIAIQRPDGVVEKHLFGDFNRFKRGFDDSSLEFGDWKCWFERDPFDESERASEIISFTLTQNLYREVESEYSRELKPLDEILIPKIRLPAIPDKAWFDPAEDRTLTIAGMKPFKAGLILSDARGSQVLVDKWGQITSAAWLEERLDWASGLQLHGTTLKLEKDNPLKPIGIDANCEIEMGRFEGCEIHVVGLDCPIEYWLRSDGEEIQPLYLPPGQSSINVLSSSSSKRSTAVLNADDWVKRVIPAEDVFPRIYSDEEIPGAVSVRFVKSWEYEETWKKENDLSYVRDFGVMSELGGKVLDEIGVGEESLAPGKYWLAARLSGGASYFRVRPFEIFADRENIVELPAVLEPTLYVEKEENWRLREAEERAEAEDLSLDFQYVVFPIRVMDYADNETSLYGGYKYRGIPDYLRERMSGAYRNPPYLPFVTMDSPGEHLIALFANDMPVGASLHEIELNEFDGNCRLTAYPRMHVLRFEISEEDFESASGVDEDLEWSLERKVKNLPAWSKSIRLRHLEDHQYEADGKVIYYKEYFLPEGEYQLIQHGGYPDSSYGNNEKYDIELDRIALDLKKDKTIALNPRLFAEQPEDAKRAISKPRIVSVPLPQGLGAKSYIAHARFWVDGGSSPSEVFSLDYNDSVAKALIRRGEIKVVVPTSMPIDKNLRMTVVLQEIGPMQAYDGKRHAWMSDVMSFADSDQRGIEASDPNWVRPTLLNRSVTFDWNLSDEDWNDHRWGARLIVELPCGESIPFHVLLWHTIGNHSYRYYGGPGIGPVIPRGKSILKVIDRQNETIESFELDVPEDAKAYTLPAEIEERLLKMGVVRKRW